MRCKLIIAFALIICMGAMIFPAASAANELVVDAQWQDDDLLRIEIQGNVVELQIADYVVNAETVTIQAVDADGNVSETITITNPNYITADTPPFVTESTAPNNPNAFTPDGTGTVVDNVLEQNGKEFFTVTTEAGNEFFIIIDRLREHDNVYLLNQVTEQDLMALAQPGNGLTGGDGTTQSGIPEPPPPQPPMPEPEPTPQPEPISEPWDSGRGGGSIFIIILAILAVGGTGYYFKIIKPKQQGFDDEDYDDGNEIDDSALDEDDDSERGGDER